MKLPTKGDATISIAQALYDSELATLLQATQFG